MVPKNLVKLAVALLVFLAAAPFLLNLLPEALTLERIIAGFEEAGYEATGFTRVASPQLEAVEQAQLTLAPPSTGTAPLHVSLYRFDNTGKLRKQHEYHKPDAAQGMAQAFVQTTGLGATRQPTPVAAATNGLWLIVITGSDQSAVRAAAARFESL